MINKETIQEYIEQYQAMYEEALAKLKGKKANAKTESMDLINRVEKELEEYKSKLEELKENIDSGVKEKIEVVKVQTEDLWDNFKTSWNELLDKGKLDTDDDNIN